MRVMRVPGHDRLCRLPGDTPVLELNLGPFTPERVAKLNRLVATMDDDFHVRRRAYTSAEVGEFLLLSERTLRRVRAAHPDEITWRDTGSRVLWYPEDIELLRLFLRRGGRQ